MDRYSHLRARAAEFVAEWVQWGAVLVLAPVREAADEVALEACGDALVGVHRLAFRELVLELSAAELNRRALVPVGRIVREALAARVTQEAVGAGRLSYLGPVAGFPGFPRALADTFEELRLNAVPLDRLRECGESGADLALLLGAYQDELAARGFADHATRVELARLGTRGSSFARRPWWRSTWRRARAPSANCSRSVLNTARAHLDLRLAAGDAPPQSSLESLQRYLFSGDAVPPREEDGSVAIFSTSGEALECVEIARRIGAAADRGVPFDQIAIPRPLARTLPAAGGGRLAPRRNSGPLHARLAAARRRRAQLSRPAALRRGATLRFALRRVSLARPDAARTRSRARPPPGSACWWTPR